MSKVLVVADNAKVTAELVAAAGDAVVVESKSSKAVAEYAKNNSFDQFLLQQRWMAKNLLLVSRLH